MSAAYKSFDLEDGNYIESNSEASSATIGRSSESPSSNPPPKYLKTRTLILTSRGVSHRHRHLLNDIHSFLPHTYKDTKLDTKSSNHYNATLNALAELHSCNHIFFLEARKNGQDLYLWLARPPNGPTVKFSVSNVHTTGELGFGGNCLKGGRGIVVFDKSFEDSSLVGTQTHRGVIRELLRGVFCVPERGVRGMKPFVDRVTGIFVLDNKIWVRVYEIREGEKTEAEKAGKSNTDISLVEIGPRFVLTPIVILEGSFGGPVIYENKEYVSSNQIRSDIRAGKAKKHAMRMDKRRMKVMERSVLRADGSKENPLGTAALFD